jgi:hypothetical protein
MSISELIWALQDIENKHGDLDCVHIDGVFEREASPRVCKSKDFPDKKVVRI